MSLIPLRNRSFSNTVGFQDFAGSLRHLDVNWDPLSESICAGILNLCMASCRTVTLFSEVANSENRRGSNKAKSFLPTVQISRRIRQVFRPRFTWRPYMLRAYFDTQLLIAESKGLIAHDFRVFFMGHVGSIDATYTTNKSMLPEKLLDAMQESFTRAEKYLDIETIKENKSAKAKQSAHTIIQNANSEQLGAILEALEKLKAGKMPLANA